MDGNHNNPYIYNPFTVIYSLQLHEHNVHGKTHTLQFTLMNRVSKYCLV